MGILVDAFAIAFGGLLGSIFKERILLKNFSVLGISIMIISAVGFFENMFNVKDMQLESAGLMVVVFSLIIGSIVGDALHIDEKLSYFASSRKAEYNAFIDTALFFGIGGLQISGPIILAVNNDSTQLLIKSIIDFPFALIFGATYGKITSLSAVPVAAMQIIIAVLARFAGVFMSDALIGQLCAIGYIVLFFSGFNLICDTSRKINNSNMLPGIFIIILYNLISEVWRLII